jgi:hypothetical protein
LVLGSGLGLGCGQNGRSGKQGETEGGKNQAAVNQAKNLLVQFQGNSKPAKAERPGVHRRL